MLSIDHQQTINGITVYRDFQDPSQYYYLPSEKVKIANNGKGIQFVAYIDGEVVEGTEPNFTDNMDRTGGFLTLEVELGPEDNEVQRIREQLAATAGDQVRLTQAPFTNGAVKLVMFGSQGGDSNSPIGFTVAGSTKPAMLGKQTAVFSLRLAGHAAQIMWSLLKGGSQTQVGVVYDLDYLGVMPAYHLEIEVDFKATEDFWQHHIDADMNLESGSLKIVSNNDVDLIMRDLVNQGSIKVKQVDYSGGNSTANPLGADDPNAMKLVRDLMSPTLFEATAIPRDDYNVLGSTLPSEREGGRPSTPTGSDVPRSTPTPTPIASTPTPTPTPTPTTSATVTTSPTASSPSPSITPVTPTTTTTSPVPTNIPSNDDGETPIPPPSTEPPPRITTPPPTTQPPPTTHPPTTQPPTTPPPTTQPPTTRPPTTQPPTTQPPTTPPPEVPEKVSTRVSINAGYSLRHRSISQRVKRTYVFDKAEAKTHTYHPSGALTLEGTDFDAEKQLMLVRLGEGPFKDIKIEIRSALDFEEFQIQEAIVHLSYGFKERAGDKTKRLHEESIAVSPEKPRTFISFFADAFGTLSFDYFVEFIHKPGSIIGTHETKIRSRTFENVTVRDIAVNISDHSPLIPVEIQPGNITFSDDGIQSVQVLVAPQKNANGRTVIYKKDSSDLKKFLISPATPGQYVYFKREKFFFKEDSIEQEFENQRDSQVIVNRPETRMLNISPILVNTGNLISKAIVKVSYRNVEGEDFEKALVLNASDGMATQQTFAIVVEDDDPRIWFATTQFVLTNGEIVEGVERTYTIEQPPISLETCGLKVLRVFPLLEAETFSASIVAIQVQVFDNDGGDTPLETVVLRKNKPEETVVLKGVDVSDPLSAVVQIIRRDGTKETMNFVVPAGQNELPLEIFTI